MTIKQAVSLVVECDACGLEEEIHANVPLIQTATQSHVMWLDLSHFRSVKPYQLDDGTRMHRCLACIPAEFQQARR